jgi:hypothetical protein
VRFGAGEAQGGEEVVREVRQVADAVGGVVELQGVNGLHLEAADAAFLHDAHLALELRCGDGRTEPPPADHDAGIVGGMLEIAAEVCEGGWCSGRHPERCQRQQGGDGDPGEFCAHCFHTRAWRGSAQAVESGLI